MKLKACLFDLDGVIVDTAIYHFKAWKKLANQLGIDIDENRNEELKGISRIDSLKKILGWAHKEVSEAELQSLSALKNKWYVEMIGHLQPGDELPGARKFLESVKLAGWKTAIGSVSKNAPLVLERLKLTSLFDAIIDGSQVTHSKPDPEVFLKGAAALGVTPQECIVFEDAIAGIEAAVAGGMYSIGIGNPRTLSKADLVVPGLSALSVEQLKDLPKHREEKSVF